jgi:hypothetical protein
MASAAAASAAAVGGAGYGASAAAGSDGGAAAAAAQHEALIKSRPEFAAMGKLFKSSAPVRWVVCELPRERQRVLGGNKCVLGWHLASTWLVFSSLGTLAATKHTPPPPPGHPLTSSLRDLRRLLATAPG